MKKLSLALLTTALGLSSTMATAQVFIDDHSGASSEAIEKVNTESQKVQKVVKKSVAKKGLTNKVSTTDFQQKISTFNHIGNKTSTEKIQGFVNEISIREALENIVPEAWQIKVNEKVDLNKKINFAGGETWNDTIERIGKDNFSATFNWDTKELKIVPTTTQYKAHTITSTQFAKNHNAVKAAHLNKATKGVKSLAKNTETKVAQPKTWLLSKNLTLKENIEVWAKKAGWTVSWKAPDYNVIANATLNGDIDSENGPIISILKLYEDANLPLKVDIMGGNKVIGVESRNYIPKESVDLTLGVK